MKRDRRSSSGYLCIVSRSRYGTRTCTWSDYPKTGIYNRTDNREKRTCKRTDDRNGDRSRVRSRFWPMLVSMSCLATACDRGQLPLDADIQVAPTERQFAITAVADGTGRCVFDESNHQDIPVVISLRDSQGSPMTRAELVVQADYAGNSYPGLQVLGLYDDRNGNGVIDGDSELVSGVGASLFTTRTDRYSGDKNFWLRVNLSCPFAGEVRAFAGDLTGRVRIEVIAAATMVATTVGQARVWQ